MSLDRVNICTLESDVKDGFVAMSGVSVCSASSVGVASFDLDAPEVSDLDDFGRTSSLAFAAFGLVSLPVESANKCSDNRPNVLRSSYSAGSDF